MTWFELSYASTAFRYTTPSSLLVSEKWFHNYVGYSPVWFAPRYTYYYSWTAHTCPATDLVLSLLILECAPYLYFNVDTTHHHDPAFTLKWTHKICTLCLWARCMLSRSTPFAPRLEAKLLNATRYVKISCKFMNPPKHGSHACLEEGKGLCL